MPDNGLPKLNTLSVESARRMLEDVENFIEHYEWSVSSYIIDEDADKLVELMKDLNENIFKTIRIYEKNQINLSRRG